MNLNELIEKIDSCKVSGYPVNESAVIEKCRLIQEGLNRLKNNSMENSGSKIEFFKRINWFGYELGHNKALESSKYVSQHLDFMKEAKFLAPSEFKKATE